MTSWTKFIIWLKSFFMIKQLKNIENFKGGLNTRDNAFQLQPNELSEISNCRINQFGNIEKRKGYSEININTIESGRHVTNIFQFKDKYGNKLVFCICGQKLYILISNAFILAGSNIKLLSANKKTSIFQWKDNVFISNGYDPAFHFQPNVLMAQTTNSSLLVADSNNKRISIFNNRGGYNGQFGKNGEQGLVKGIVSSYGQYYFVLDSTSVRKYDQYFNFISTIITGLTTAEDIQILDDQNFILILSSGDNCVYKYGYDGTAYGPFIADYDWFGYDYPIALDTPKAFFQLGHIVVIADYGANAVRVWNDGVWEGTIPVSQPIAVYYDYTKDYIYVLCENGNKVKYYDYNFTGTAYVAGPPGTKIDELYDINNYPFGNGSAVSGTTVRNVTDGSIGVIDDIGNYYVKCNGGMIGGTYGQWQNGDTYRIYGIFLGEWDVVDGHGISGDRHNEYIFVSSETGKISRTDLHGTNTLVIVNSTGSVPGSLDTPLNMEVVDSSLYISSEVFSDLGSPDACVATGSTVGGLPNGTYKYKLTYATTTLESSGGLESNEVTVNLKEIDLSEIPTPTNSFVTNINIYRTKAGGSVFYYIAQLSPTNGVWPTTYSDNISDSSIDENDVIPTENNLVPLMKYLIQFKDMLFGAGDWANPNYLYWTGSLDENKWELTYYDPIGADEGTYITGLYVLGDNLIVFKSDSIWSISPFDNDGVIMITKQQITAEYGCISRETIEKVTINGQNGLIFADKEKGICFLSGGTVVTLSNKIDTTWQSFNKLYLEGAVGKYYEARDEYWLAINSGSTDNDKVIIFNLKNKTFSYSFDLSICSLANIDIDGVVNLWSGNFSGWVYKQDNTERDYFNNAIPSYFVSAWLNFGYPNNTKIFKKIIINYIEKGSWDITVYYAVDGAAFSSINSFTISMAGTPGNRNKFVKKLGNVSGKTIRVKIENNNLNQPYEICDISCEFSMHKIRI